MKKIVLGLMIVLTSGFVKAQECDSLVNQCYKYLLNEPRNNKVFISDGQVYQAFVDVEQSAEFKVTLYGGTLYRVATTAGLDDNYVVFNVYDQDRNLLFTNQKYNNKPYWDFKVDNTTDCFIEAYLDIDKKVSGCLVILLGFQK
jgi:hypothetical protein